MDLSQVDGFTTRGPADRQADGRVSQSVKWSRCDAGRRPAGAQLKCPAGAASFVPPLSNSAFVRASAVRRASGESFLLARDDEATL